MLRRSLRLLESGYYTAEGSPSISYKEKIYRIFRRRTQQNGQNLLNYLNFEDTMENTMTFDPDEPFRSCVPDGWLCETNETQISRVKTDMYRCITDVRNWSCFVVVLLLAFAITCLHFQLKAVKQELNVRSQQMEMCSPVADTMANFALHSQGAMVLKELSSDTYRPTEYHILKRMMCWLRRQCKEKIVIKGHSVLRAGECWCFPGDHGHLVIALSNPATISHVTLGHITKSQSLSGVITSAPREFSVYGMQTSVDNGSYLLTAVYNENNAGFQIFALPNPDGTVFSHVKIHFHNNWGNSEQTCIYAFRVHGELAAEL
ncbi:SUN domain-containing protein 3-like [Kryptolebias marmoratus]|uniref:SUN domain-containing protein 3-like n=1 Tax=Kryptolebias marmoratus TaxID=37003 RepID=UPI0018ACCEC1|nr:SUN domain-containing protein 3-like [Kryptolebias marmoratus]